ncbi:beta-propeller fold lactonase family protein [Chitinophaga sp. SYP-B3965]|uniref:lactonase family protein n=1 Tax=Chitinophaga sp. SYP-B3965 TaxID=2663120 RepID=UPI001299F423|nr:lactonase family protein [Chitinophaga sp. SYP-B3965]MRG46153.1 beta-propeller fold lactonase family protein [Chitinophaga sp. SYP-B3965]
MRLFTLLIILLPFSTAAQTLLIGTYTKSIHVCRFDPETGAITKVSSNDELNNPSFLTVSANGQYVYAVGEASGANGGSVYALKFDGNRLELMNSQSSGGKGPCHINIDKAGRNVIVANYANGSVSVLPIQPDGSLGAPIQTIQHTGSSIVESRQKGPHAHSVNFSPDQKQVFVADLGIDKIMVYDYHPGNKKTPLTPAAIPFITTQPGMGPRHFTFHPNGKWAYVVGELNGNVTVYNYKNKTLLPVQTVSTAPGAKPQFGLADVHVTPDGNFLYVSDRIKQNYLASFKINKSNGELSFIAHEPTLGENPRNFMIDPSGKYVLVANQSTNNVVVFKRDPASDKLTPTGNQINVERPVCLQLVPVK